jgi:EmrB/QacA subfamily drug resistance transporter
MHLPQRADAASIVARGLSKDREGCQPSVALSRPRRLVVLAICCMSLLIVWLDNTIVNVALPSMGRDLHASVAGLQWIVDAYTLLLASLLILSGSIADRVGRRRVFQLGLGLFALGSLLCSLAPTLAWLICFRMLLAIAGSMLNPVAMSIIRNTFTDPGERARAIGFLGATVGLSLALGPVIGGTLVQPLGWRAVFYINVPVCLLALALTMRFVPESRAPRARRLDPVGEALVIVMLGAVTYAIIEGPATGWMSAEIVALVITTLVSLAALIRYEHRREEPLLDLRFFRSVPFSGATLTAVSALAALGGFLFLNTLYLQDVRGLSPLYAGLYTLPVAAMTLLFSPISGRLVARRGARDPLVISGCGLTIGSVMLTGANATTPVASLLGAYVIFGIGFGMVNPPITNAALSGMPASQAGVAGAIASTSRQVGLMLGVAIVGATASHIPAVAHTATRSTLHLHGWWIIVACSLAVLALGLTTTPAKRTRTHPAIHPEPTPEPHIAPSGQ